MDIEELQLIASKGEDGRHQFKADANNGDSLGSEMAAFANSEGGTILIGITDSGALQGVARDEVGRINQLISNAASQHVRSPLSVQTENVLLENQRIVVAVTVPPGMDKPYFDRRGVIWLKCGSDKRRVNSKEELRRIFQETDQFHADELQTRAEAKDLDRDKLRDFLQEKHGIDIPEDKAEYLHLLETLSIATKDGHLTLAGVLMFAKKPQQFRPQFLVKAACFPGTDVHTTDYLDMEDIHGTIPKMFADAKAFILRNLHKVQAGRGVNAPGTPEIPELVLEELLTNAFIHRDYLVSAPIRIFVFDDRVEIISPGHLPNNLTIEKIKFGSSNSRNPILLSLTAQGLLPYRGLGSGIRRALQTSPNISFTEDREGALFKCSIPRLKGQIEPKKPEKDTFKGSKSSFKESYPPFKGSQIDSLNEAEKEVLLEITRNPTVSYEDLERKSGKSRSTITRAIRRLKDMGVIRREGSKKTGKWQILNPESQQP